MSFVVKTLFRKYCSDTGRTVVDFVIAVLFDINFVVGFRFVARDKFVNHCAVGLIFVLEDGYRLDCNRLCC